MAKISSGSGFISSPQTSRNLEINISQINENKIIEDIQENIKANGNIGIIGIITNTLNRTMEIAKSLTLEFGHENVTVAHSRFISTDRLIKDAEVLEIAGKNSQRDVFKIVVGTQVLEQSLDIDFDLLYSDIAPLDSIIQRMGRLHRHGRNRTHKPIFKIIHEDSIDEKYKLAKIIYKNWLIDVAEEYLKDKERFILPHQINEAVEWLPNNYEINENYKEFINNNKNIRKKSRDFTLPKASINKTKSIHGAFNIKTSNNSNYMEAQVRNIELISIEVLAIFKGENGGLWIPHYNNGIREEYYISIDGEIDWIEEKMILSSTVKLPAQLSTLKTIQELENTMDHEFNQLRNHWKQSKILHEELVIFLNPQKGINLADNIIRYTQKFGLEIKSVQPTR